MKIFHRVNGDISEEERKQLELEYVGTTKSAGHGILSNGENHKITSAVQSQGSVLKVAMFGEFEVPSET